jgi:hypothetical protein
VSMSRLAMCLPSVLSVIGKPHFGRWFSGWQ